MATYKIAVLPGDGIGQEVTPQAQRILQLVGRAAGIGFEFESGLVGGSAIDAAGTPLPPATLALCQQAHAILFGAVGGPKWDTLPQEQRPERGLLGIRKELVQQYPWLPSSVYKAFCEAKALAMVDLLDVNALMVTLPWLIPETQETMALMGKDFWSYGIHENMREIEALAKYLHEQGLIERKVKVEELFHPSMFEISRV